MPSNEYLESIKRKLDALNKEAGTVPGQKGNNDSTKTKWDPEMPDPMQWQGQAALKWMADQKIKNGN